MDGLYTLARIIVGIMALITLGGLVWFGSTLSNQVLVAGIVLGCCSLLASLFSQKLLSSLIATVLLVAIALTGAVAGLVLLIGDLGEFPDIAWDVLSAQFLHVVALGTLAIQAIRLAAKEKTR